MPRLLIILIGVFSAAMACAGEKAAPRLFTPPKAYFPAGTFEGSTLEWYAKNLRVLQEPSLADRKDAGPDVYRLLWMRSFHSPMVFRLEFSADGIARLTVKKARLEEVKNHNLEPTKLTSNTQKKIATPVADNFLRLFDASTFSKRSLGDPREEMGGADGSTWVFEAIQKGVYHVTTRWSPLPPLVPPGDSDPVFAKFRQKDGEEIALDMASLFLIFLGEASSEQLY